MDRVHSGSPPGAPAPCRRAQHRHHRARRPREDDAGRRHAAPDGRLPRQRAGRRPGDGLLRARARARHHHPGQEHDRHLGGRAHQHRGHARALGLRRRGRAHPGDGRRRAPPGRRLRGAAAPDPLRAREGARGGAPPGRLLEQDRPGRRAPGGGARRDLRPVHRPRRERGAARFPGRLHQCPRGHGHPGPRARGTDLRPLFAAVARGLPGPPHEPDAPLRFQANNLGYDDYVGRLAIGRIVSGELVAAGQYTLCRLDGSQAPCKLTRIYGWQGLKRIELERASAGDLVAIAGIEDINIGETVADRERPEALPLIRIDEPTIAMVFAVNTSPWAGRSGSQVTSRKRRERLRQESRRNVSLRVEETGATGAFRVLGRGELQLAILIETMRREGFELQACKPAAVVRERVGVLEEPMELLLVDVPEEYVGIVTQLLGVRRAVMARMEHVGGGRVRIEYGVPSRGLIGFRSHFLTDTRGTGTLNTLFNGYAPWHGPIPARTNGAMVADREGVATPYALFHLQERGVLFVPAGTPVYEGMVVGEYSRDADLDVNVCREKKLSNMRAAGHDEAVRLVPHRAMGLEDGLEWIDEDELVEVTPDAIRLRKRELRQALRPRGPRAGRIGGPPAVTG